MWPGVFYFEKEIHLFNNSVSIYKWHVLQGCELTSCTRLHRIRARLLVLDNSLVQLQNQERVFICCCAGYPVFAVVMLVCYCREPVSLPT